MLWRQNTTRMIDSNQNTVGQTLQRLMAEDGLHRISIAPIGVELKKKDTVPVINSPNRATSR